jgi:hypothetical protein
MCLSPKLSSRILSAISKKLMATEYWPTVCEDKLKLEEFPPIVERAAESRFLNSTACCAPGTLTMKKDVAHGTVAHSLLWLPLDLVAYESPLTVQSK